MVREFTTDVSNHSNLPDKPTATAEELKRIWDKAANDIKDYINEVLIPDLSDTFLNLDGGTINGNMMIKQALTVLGQTILKSSLEIDGVLNLKGGLTVNSEGTAGGIENYGDTPYIDFHFNNSSSDYTTRLIEERSGELSLKGIFNISRGLKFNGSNLISFSWSTENGGRLNVYIDENLAGYIPLS